MKKGFLYVVLVLVALIFTSVLAGCSMSTFGGSDKVITFTDKPIDKQERTIGDPKVGLKKGKITITDISSTISPREMGDESYVRFVTAVSVGMPDTFDVILDEKSTRIHEGGLFGKGVLQTNNDDKFKQSKAITFTWDDGKMTIESDGKKQTVDISKDGISPTFSGRIINAKVTLTN